MTRTPNLAAGATYVWFPEVAPAGDWVDRAACRGHDTARWFPARPESAVGRGATENRLRMRSRFPRRAPPWPTLPRRSPKGGSGRRFASNGQSTEPPRPAIADWHPDPTPADTIGCEALDSLRTARGWKKPE